jgi:predicted nucleic acid-binding protein
MIVVADASPLNYLIQINCDSLIRDLYGSVLVPASVMEELAHPSAPTAVAAWLLRPPSWIDVRTVSVREDARMEALDRGEREAIQLAEEQHANLLLIDERLGRSEAKRRGISTTGTLGILLAGGERRLIEPELAFQQLIEQTNFRATPKLRESFAEQCREFRQRK